MKAFNIQTKLFSCLKTYDKKTFMSDLMAGIIVGIVALPLAIAFGIASGVTPEKGIITAIVAGLVISLFGGSKVQIGGPTGAFIIIIYGIIQKYGFEGLTIATLMAGFFLVLFGLLRLGTIIKYIPYPIVVGFTSGIAVTIFTTQIKDLFGLTLPSNPSDFIEKWGVYLQNFNTIDPWCALIGVASVVVIAVTPRFSKKIPGSLIAIILMTIVALLLKNFAGVLSIETIGDRFSISNELPAAQVPYTTLFRSGARHELGNHQELGITSYHHCHPGSHRVFALSYCSRWCYRRPPRFQYRVGGSGTGEHCLSPLWRYSCHRSHSPHHDQY